MIFVIAVAAVFLPVLFGLGLAAGISRFDHVIETTKEEVANKDKGYEPDVTMGYRIRTTNDSDTQIKEARILAAKKAAATPRGANVKIGSLAKPQLKTAWEGVDADPLTAARIAEFHGWEGVKTGTSGASAAPVAAAGTGGAVKIKLIPGTDYEFTAITASMSKDERKVARRANAKARYAAFKKAKATGMTASGPIGAAPPRAAAAAPVAATADSSAAAAPPAAPPVVIEVPAHIKPPVLIEITDDMDKAAKSKARIANSKAKSAYNKALKEAGIDPAALKASQQAAAAAAAAPQAAAAPPPTTAAPAAAETVQLPPGIEPPALVEITDDMDKAAKSKARIANSKAKSAFNKALKAAGIDPKSVDLSKLGSPAPAAAAATSASAPAASDAPQLPPGIEPPVLIEITDGMDKAEKSKARIANSKAKSAFNKALKAAGIDPKSIDLSKLRSAAPAAQASAPAAAPAPAPTTVSGPQLPPGIEPLVLVEITPDMSKEEKSKARIANSKAKSAYNKALKAAGIDPKSLS